MAGWRAGPGAPAGLYPAAVLVAVNLVDGTETSLVAGALPLLQDEWGFSDTLAGAIPTAASIAGLLVLLPAGQLADRASRVRLLTVVVASWAVLTTASALATGFWTFFAVRVVLGSANSLDNPSASSLITDFHPPQARSRVFAVQRAAWTVGASLGAALGGVLGETFGWQAPFLVMAVPGLVVAWCLSRIREPVRGGLDPPGSAPVETSDALGLGARLRVLWSFRVLRAVYVGAAVAYLGFNGLGYWAPSLFEREFDLGEGTAASLTGVLGITATVVGSAVGGILGDRWGGQDAARRVLLAGAGLAGGGVVVVVAFLVPVLVPQLLLLVVGASAIVSAAPNFASIIADVLPATRRGLGYAFFTFVIAAGGALGPLVIGALSDLSGSLRLAFVLGLLPVVPGGLAVLAARRFAPSGGGRTAGELASVHMSLDCIAGIVREHAADRPDAAAYVLGEHVVTFRDLDRRSNRVAGALAAAGVGRQDRVAFLDKNSLEFFDVLFGAAKLDAVPVPVNWRLAPPEAAFIVNDARAKVLVVGRELVPLLDAMEPELTAGVTIVVIGDHDRHPGFEEWIAAHPDADPGVVPDPGDIAFQFYSSGTTGLPKGVMLTNENCFANLEGTKDLINIDADSVSLVVMPLFHVAGGFWGLFALAFGRPSVLQREVDPVGILELIERHRVTHAVFVPALLQVLVSLPQARTADLSSMRALVYGASPISEEVLTASLETFRCSFLQAYGMTETSGGVVLLRPEDHDPSGPNRHRLRAAGRPGPGSEVRVVDAETLADVATGEVGEVIVRSPQNMAGYWNQPEETARTLLADGWLRTGDAGYLDADGYLYIHDRVKDMIISGGENVYPAEVENRLMSHPGVADVAVIGVPDERWGETPKALVVRVPGVTLTEAEVIEFARAGLAHYKCPTSVEWRDELPRNPSGKILKKDLRQPYWEGRGRNVN